MFERKRVKHANVSRSGPACVMEPRQPKIDGSADCHSRRRPVNSAAGGGTPVETGGRDDHVRRTRSLSRRALGGDRDPGRLHRLRPHRAHPRDAGRQPSPAAGGRGVLSRHRHLDHAFRRHAGGAVAGGHRLSGAADHHVVPDLRAGRRHFPVLRQHRRAVDAARGVFGGAARGRYRQHALCRHAWAVRQFRHDA